MGSKFWIPPISKTTRGFNTVVIYSAFSFLRSCLLELTRRRTPTLCTGAHIESDAAVGGPKVMLFGELANAFRSDELDLTRLAKVDDGRSTSYV